MGSGVSGIGKFDKQNKFFGNYRDVSNKYMILEKQVTDNDHFLIFTNNVESIKGNPVLVVDNDKVVYLKDWNIAGANIRDKDGNVSETYAVKLDRNYFKTYTFKNNIGDYSFDQQDTFDSLLSVAKQQERQRNRISPRRIFISNDGMFR